jgi:hypothetical protein
VSDLVSIAGGLAGTVVAGSVLLFSGRDATPLDLTGLCVNLDQGIFQLVDCDSGAAQQRLVKFAGRGGSASHIDCPQGADTIGIRSGDEDAEQRWCATKP